MTTDVQTTVYRCTACGAANRLNLARLADGPTCGKCRAALLPGEPVNVTDATVADVVTACPVPVLLDIWAPWCGPCKMVAPVVAQVAAERRGRLLVAKLNSDDNPRTASQFGVQSIPTLILLQQGRILHQVSGALPKSQLDSWLAQHLR